MHEVIAERLRRVYPTGDVDAPDTDVLFGADYIDMVTETVELTCMKHGMWADIDLHSSTDRTRGFAITE